VTFKDLAENQKIVVIEMSEFVIRKQWHYEMSKSNCSTSPSVGNTSELAMQKINGIMKAQFQLCTCLFFVVALVLFIRLLELMNFAAVPLACLSLNRFFVAFEPLGTLESLVLQLGCTISFSVVSMLLGSTCIA
jgi:hypothetical protein